MIPVRKAYTVTSSNPRFPGRSAASAITIHPGGEALAWEGVGSGSLFTTGARSMRNTASSFKPGRSPLIAEGQVSRAAAGVETSTAEGTVEASVVGRGGRRAAQYSEGWPSASLQSAIERFAPGAEGVASSQKTIYTGEAGVQVVVDNAGNYFRIQNINLPGRRTYLDLNGNVPNNKVVNGRTVGRTQAEYNQITHFNNIDK